MAEYRHNVLRKSGGITLICGSNKNLMSIHRLVRGIFFCCILLLGIQVYSGTGSVGRQGDKVLNVAIPACIDHFDPAKTVNRYSIQLLGKSYERLLSYRSTQESVELVPNLVESMPEVSGDGRVYTFRLRKGISFHDDRCFVDGRGRELTAEDVVYSFKRIADPYVQSTYYAVNFKNLIVGFEELHQHFKSHRGDYALAIDGLKAIDRYTVQFKLKEPFPLFLHYITMSCGSIVAREAVDFYGDSFLNHPVGTGPFILRDFNSQSNKITFVRNKRFREKYCSEEILSEDGHLLCRSRRNLPFLSKIVYHILPEESSRWLQFKRKAIDIFNISGDCLPNVFTGEGQLRPELCKEGIELCQAPSYRMMYVGFNCSKSPFANKKLRQAMSLAFDRVEFNRLFLKGMGKLPNGYIPECFLGYDPDYKNPYNYDLVRAKQYLADAGYPDGRDLSSISLITPLGSGFKSQAEFFAKCMEKIGIKVEVRQLMYPELLKKINEGQYMLVMHSWGPDYPDAASGLFTLIRSKIGGIIIDDPTFNVQYDRSILLSDLSKRALCYQMLDALATELSPAILLPILPIYVLKHSYVKNFLIDVYDDSVESLCDKVLA